MIAELGCDEAQGYLFSPPKPLEEALLLAALDTTPRLGARPAEPTRSPRFV
jgi:EAL domain-containing protein (putative c-di-GMP-specific phosphodiesterase class I)